MWGCKTDETSGRAAGLVLRSTGHLARIHVLCIKMHNVQFRLSDHPVNQEDALAKSHPNTTFPGNSPTDKALV